MQITTDVPPPPKRNWVLRLPSSVKLIQPGQSFLTDAKTAKCFLSYGRLKGWDVRQKREGLGVRCWRVASIKAVKAGANEEELDRLSEPFEALTDGSTLRPIINDNISMAPAGE